MTSDHRPNLFDSTQAVWPPFEQWLQFQQQQWQSLWMWHQSLLAIQRDFQDQWMSLWADGARLDD
jgi:hypothetical protein